MTGSGENQKITYDEFLSMLRDPDIEEHRLRPYVLAVRSTNGPFNPTLRANPDLVIMSDLDITAENAMGIGNHLARTRRRLKFLFSGLDHVLVSEGDSWFQFPILAEDVIDHLSRSYRVLSLGAAGDTVDNMVSASREYITALNDQRDDVRAFLFSGAGNDIIGQGPSGEPMLEKLLVAGSGLEPSSYVNAAELDSTILTLRNAYSRVIADVRQIVGLPTLPILFHGYDYVLPFPASQKDDRTPVYAEPNAWLGAAFEDSGIVDAQLRRDVVRLLIDRLYEMLFELESEHEFVFVVDLRGTLPLLEDWRDEIHPVDAGYARIAQKFDTLLRDLFKLN